MSTIQDREEIGGNRYIVTPLIQIQGYRIDIMMAEYFDSLDLSPYRFLQEARAAYDRYSSVKLNYSPFLLHWIRITDTGNGRFYCLNHREAQAFALLFGLCNYDGGNHLLLADLIKLALEGGSFMSLQWDSDDRIDALREEHGWISRNIGDIKMVDRPEHRLGIAIYSCIPQPAIRNIRADYCVLSRFDYERFKLNWKKPPALCEEKKGLTPSDELFFWLRLVDGSTGDAYSLSGLEADAFIMFRHRRCWGKSIHCVFDIGILSESIWDDRPDARGFVSCLDRNSFYDHFRSEAWLPSDGE